MTPWPTSATEITSAVSAERGTKVGEACWRNRDSEGWVASVSASRASTREFCSPGYAMATMASISRSVAGGTTESVIDVSILVRNCRTSGDSAPSSCSAHSRRISVIPA